jgi:UDP-N-acetylglucosamine--dolichyl-phosphate N-acetylglucosaminephosphotransferase
MLYLRSVLAMHQKGMKTGLGFLALTLLASYLLYRQGNDLWTLWLAGHVAFVVCDRLVQGLSPLLLKAGRSGRDLNKKGQPELPESLGVAAGAVYVMTLIVLLPVVCPRQDFRRFGDLMATLVSVLSMLVVGFVDDVVDLKWRHKTLLPAVAGLPLLVIYRMCSGGTMIVVPRILREQLGLARLLDLGHTYYAWMLALIVFCTHSINILAGVNGVEVGQSLVLAAFAILHNVICILQQRDLSSLVTQMQHWHSLLTLGPFMAVGLALLRHNWYPARVFVGDTWCYFAGMTLAVAGILGHYSKTLLALFALQLLNFAISLPQLIRLVPCPRHRLPRANGQLMLGPSTFLLEPSSSPLAIFICRLFSNVGICRLRETDKGLECTNFTVLNILLVRLGPMREDRLCIVLLSIQCLWCSLALHVRHSRWIQKLF